MIHKNQKTGLCIREHNGATSFEPCIRYSVARYFNVSPNRYMRAMERLGYLNSVGVVKRANKIFKYPDDVL